MNKSDISNLLVFLNRVQLNGTEAAELVRLQQLLVKMGNEMIEVPIDK